MSQIDWTELVARALHEDGAYSDVTTLTYVSEECTGRAEILARTSGVVCGVAAAQEAFKQAGTGIDQEWHVVDGEPIEPDMPWVTLTGRLRPMLIGERTALNFLARLSGIATLTHQFVSQVAGTKCIIRDTRKTTPGLRDAEKYAVRCGGAQNHRHNLASAGLIKENHIFAAGGIDAVLKKLQTFADRKTAPQFELEVESMAELQMALEVGVKEILLDNFDVVTTAAAVRLNDGRALLETSGGVTLANVAEYAKTGVDRIAIGALTHSAKPIDMTMLVREVTHR